MPGNDEALTARANVLYESVQDLVVSVGDLRVTNQKLAARGHWNRVLILATIIGLVVDLALSGLFVYQHLAQVETNHRIDCTNQLRSATSKIADLDRINVDTFFQNVASIKTAAEFEAAYHRYITVRNADDQARAKLGQSSAKTCA